MANLTKEQRAEKELAARYESGEILENTRLPVSNTAANAPEPFTPAAAALPTGTPGTFDVDNAEETVRLTSLPDSPQPMTVVRFKRGYFFVGGGAKTEVGTEMDLPRADARYLIESGICEYVDNYIVGDERPASRNSAKQSA